jgi:hypothetical protein
MARYIVLRVDKNENADKLLKKFEGSPAIEVLGLFASGTKFCPGKSVCGQERKYVRSRRWGTTHCSICKLPVSSTGQQPRNLLNDPDLHPRFNDLTLTVWEPYETPERKYGEDAIQRMKNQASLGRKRMQRYWAKKRREARNGG